MALIQTEKNRAIARLTGLIGAFVAPILLCVVISVASLSNSVVPDFVATPLHDPYAAEALVTLANRMMTVSGAAFIASVWLFNQPVRRRRVPLVLGLLIAQASLAFCSLYAGMRFIFDMALQIDVVQLNFELLRDRIYLQGGTLLLQISVICGHAVAHQIYRDRRHGIKSL